MVGLGNIDDVYKHYLVVIEENAKLKELLKECREWLYDDMSEDFEVGRMEFLTKIDEVLI